jgi:uncharacterized protein (TIGR03083 family)
MEISEYISAIQREGDLLAVAAASAGMDAAVPTCPGWQMRDLVRHIGSIHRWAAEHIEKRSPDRIVRPSGGEVVWPDDGTLVDWFREGHAALVYTLETADPDLICWTFIPAPSPLAFWARRQAHETGIHRADAQSAGTGITAFPAACAADGIDELLFGVVSRRAFGLRADPPRTLHAHATDAAGEWLVSIGPGGIEVRSEHVKADCAVRGTCSDLFLLLWNRRTAEGLEVFGDRTLLDLWRDTVRI